MQLFCDLDGTLADFVGHYTATCGVPPPEGRLNNRQWRELRAAQDFYANLPLMPDARELWDRIARHGPTIITGLPVSIPTAADQKRAWVRQHLGEHVGVICCLAREKCHHAQPGDILIDNSERFRHLWIEAGGIYIVHRSAAATADELSKLGL